MGIASKSHKGLTDGHIFLREIDISDLLLEQVDVYAVGAL